MFLLRYYNIFYPKRKTRIKWNNDDIILKKELFCDFVDVFDDNVTKHNQCFVREKYKIYRKLSQKKINCDGWLSFSDETCVCLK